MNAAALKAVRCLRVSRGFESHPLRLQSRIRLYRAVSLVYARPSLNIRLSQAESGCLGVRGWHSAVAIRQFAAVDNVARREPIPSMKAKRLLAVLERKPLSYRVVRQSARIAAWRHRAEGRSPSPFMTWSITFQRASTSSPIAPSFYCVIRLTTYADRLDDDICSSST